MTPERLKELEKRYADREVHELIAELRELKGWNTGERAVDIYGRSWEWCDGCAGYRLYAHTACCGAFGYSYSEVSLL